MKNVLLLVGILICQLTLSQENFTPGYVIKNNADTLFGFVDYKNWVYNPRKIYFKTNIENNPVSFTPNDIAEFKVKGSVYVSGIVNVETSSIKTEELNEDPQVKIKVDTVFLQTLFKGKKSLYYYKSPDGRENFYSKQNTGFDLLIYKRYLKIQDGKNFVVENKKYLGQLTLYLFDCEAVSSKLESTMYDQESLIKLFQFYHNCLQSDVFFQKEKEKVHTEFGLLAGASLTNLEFHSKTFPYLVGAGYSPSIGLSSGLFFDLLLPRNQQNWSISNEILFSTYKVNGSYEVYENESDYSITSTTIGYSYLKINNMVRFKYPIGKIFLFLNGGISNGYSISETNIKQLESKYYTTNRVEEGLALNETRKYEQGLIFGTGVRSNRFSIELRFEKGNGMSKYSALNSTAKRYFLLVAYRF